MTQPTPTSPATSAGGARRTELAAALRQVRERIALAAAAAGRPPGDIALLAVSKTRPAADVLALLAVGQRAFGESRHQEALAKVAEVAEVAELAEAAEVAEVAEAAGDAAAKGGATSTGEQSGPAEAADDSTAEHVHPADGTEAVGVSPPGHGLAAPRWHMVGRLQTNKVKAVAGWADVVHGVDRIELLPGLARGAAARGITLEVFVQISLDEDPARGGVSPAELGRLADAIAQTPALTLAGLMAVAVPSLPARPQFARLQQLSALLVAEHPGAAQVSAGMSGDLEDAIAEGATLVRVGTALFGVRPPVLR